RRGGAARAGSWRERFDRLGGSLFACGALSAEPVESGKGKQRAPIAHADERASWAKTGLAEVGPPAQPVPRDGEDSHNLRPDDDRPRAAVEVGAPLPAETQCEVARFHQSPTSRNVICKSASEYGRPVVIPPSG